MLDNFTPESIKDAPMRKDAMPILSRRALLTIAEITGDVALTKEYGLMIGLLQETTEPANRPGGTSQTKVTVADCWAPQNMTAITDKAIAEAVWH